MTRCKQGWIITNGWEVKMKYKVDACISMYSRVWVAKPGNKRLHKNLSQSTLSRLLTFLYHLVPAQVVTQTNHAPLAYWQANPLLRHLVQVGFVLQQDFLSCLHLAQSIHNQLFVSPSRQKSLLTNRSAISAPTLLRIGGLRTRDLRSRGLRNRSCPPPRRIR